MSAIKQATAVVNATLRVPSYWPNRATRRAVKQNREYRLSPSWQSFLAVNPQLRQAIKALT